VGSDLDFSAVRHDEAVERARMLIPRLRDRVAQAEAARRLPADTMRDLHASGLIRALQPKRWGGMELDFVAYVDIPLELARGCASTSWNVANLIIHHWMLAMYEVRAQEEVWGENPEALIAAGVAYPQGHARRVDGGLVIGGRWNFCSGVDTAQWSLLAVLVRDGDTVVDHRLCLVHKSQYQVIDDWHVLGMRATASMTVTIDELFVPRHRALCAYDIRGGDGFPGAHANPNPLYRIPLSAMAAHGIGGCAAGNAEAALEKTISNVKTRSTSYTGATMRDFQVAQLRTGGAGAGIEAARRVLRADCVEAQGIAQSGAMPDIATKLKWKRNLAFATQLCSQAVDALHAMAGATGVYEQYPLERIFRDAHALAGHIMHSFDTHATAWGYAALGGATVNPTL
jgi:3-hydroxy-9,10-secoandrosta-1,3,5(10)-triene-9,17-dione monooxygenase